MSKPSIEMMLGLAVRRVVLAVATPEAKAQSDLCDQAVANLTDAIRAVVVEEITKNNQDHYNQMDRALKRWGA